MHYLILITPTYLSQLILIKLPSYIISHQTSNHSVMVDHEQESFDLNDYIERVIPKLAHHIYYWQRRPPLLVLHLIKYTHLSST